ncbi:MAG: nucleoside deaminase [Selenomonadaceae bacterium]|nr:nucleoside deaminase [Selenomonadaceae bacterium]
MNDKNYMKIALEEAQFALRKNEIPVGAVLVDEDGFIIAKTHNLVNTLNDPTAHAEILAIKQASKIYGLRLTGTSLYVTMEPCPMCAGAMVLARIRRLIYAMPSPYGAAESLFNVTNNALLNHHIEVTAGCLEESARDMMKQFFNLKR